MHPKGHSKNSKHLLRWHFHLAPSINIKVMNNNKYLFNGEVEFSAPNNLKSSIVNGWYSPSYGTKTEIKILKFELLAKSSIEEYFKTYDRKKQTTYKKICKGRAGEDVKRHLVRQARKAKMLINGGWRNI